MKVLVEEASLVFIIRTRARIEVDSWRNVEMTSNVRDILVDFTIVGSSEIIDKRLFVAITDI